MFRSIRWRLITSYVLLTLLAVSIMGLIAMVAVKRYVEQQEINYLTENAETIAREALPLMRPGMALSQVGQLVQAAAFFGNVQVRIYDHQMNLLADSGLPDAEDQYAWLMYPEMLDKVFPEADPEAWVMGLVPLRPEGRNGIWQTEKDLAVLLEALPPGSSITVIRRYDTPWGSRLEFGELASPNAGSQQAAPENTPRSSQVVTVSIGDQLSPLGYVELSGGTNFGAEALATTRQAFILAGAGAVLLAGLLGLVMGRRLSTPITQLSKTAAQMSSGDLAVRANIHADDEIGELANQFNHMAEQLQTSFAQLAAERDALRRFIADASHELRTPITALRNFNELLQGPAESDLAARKEFLVESQAQIERLIWITHNLLDLSRLEAGLVALEVGEHDAGAIVEASAAPFKINAIEKNVALKLSLPAAPLSLKCDRARLELALSNLLDNAFKYTPQGGTIEIGVRPEADGLQFWVQDSGPGIQPEDLPRIFERFYRSQDNPVPGSGLGLSIAQSIVQAHGGTISALSEPGQGACFLFEMPR
jgi:signal transduction histidine kinase